MQILCAARVVRFDLLRAIQRLATMIASWTSWCDKALHRLVCCLHHSRSDALVGYIGQGLAEINMMLDAGADFAGCKATRRST